MEHSNRIMHEGRMPADRTSRVRKSVEKRKKMSSKKQGKSRKKPVDPKEFSNKMIKLKDVSDDLRNLLKMTCKRNGCKRPTTDETSVLYIDSTEHIIELCIRFLLSCKGNGYFLPEVVFKAPTSSTQKRVIDTFERGVYFGYKLFHKCTPEEGPCNLCMLAKRLIYPNINNTVIHLNTKPVKMEKAKVCNACYKMGGKGVKLMKCKGCGLVRYCSVECQKEDWKAHKEICKKSRRK